MKTESREKALIPLFLVIIIDTMGFGFLFPVLTPLFLHGHSAILPAGTSVGMVHFYYGLVVAMYPLMMFIGAPLLGDLSDKMGRKKVLVLCLLGTGIGYLVCGWGISLGSLLLLLLGRMISGITAATLPLAMAATADVSNDPVRQAKYLGLMTLATAGGQVLGPLLAGVLSDQALTVFFTNATPFYVAFVLAVLNIGWLFWAFKETYKVEKPEQIDLLKTIRSYKDLFQNKSLLLMTLVFLCMQLDWSFFSQASPAYLEQNFAYSHFELGIFSSSLGVLIAIGGGALTPRIAQRISTRRAAIFSMFALGIGTSLAVVVKSQVIFWCATVVATLGASVAFSFIITLCSNLVEKTQQGWVMGISGAVIAIAWAASALLSGLLLNISSSFSNILGGFIGLLGCVLLWIPSGESDSF